ncbi:hypothetical protein SSCH_2200001 [Syntrophaceticus schinkii]|uniref:Uracil-DNA glycosylase-like domain-containing protein n=1 Tax=Syntrophaceticus schinkii TaxID=499207 RepID=A0A0B7MEX7_9FIRM|nr:hypothetical protein SSCH_2200001 [Syntrophaceticus schinkii]
MLLADVGWKREQVFITNAVLCNPRTEQGNNRIPSVDEIRNCSYYLSRLLT